jgi:two-component system sensor kinase FixL
MKSQSFEFQALLDAAVDGVVLIDTAGHLQAFNRAAEHLFGYEAQEVLGRPVSLLIPQPYSIGCRSEVEARRKDGSVFPAFLSVGAVAASEPPRFVGFVQDRSAEDDVHRLQRKLIQVSRLTTVGEMSAGIAHEINQPLTAVANYAQACDRLLGQPDPDIEEIRAALKQITAQAVRAGDIIRQLRSLARNDAVRRVPTNINTLIAEIAPLIARDARIHHVSYRLELARNLASARVDQKQIQHVILNLVRNAVEAMMEGCSGTPEIIIRTVASAAGGVEISVCDNGPGVLQSIGPRLFDPFCTTKTHGAGLGLAIGRRILRSHEGSLEYRSNAPSGACFTIQLPGIKQE